MDNFGAGSKSPQGKTLILFTATTGFKIPFSNHPPVPAIRNHIVSSRIVRGGTDTVHLSASTSTMSSGNSYDRSMDLSSFFLADIRAGLGPYLPIFLLADHNLSPSSIGLILSVAGLTGLVSQPFTGALIDRTGKPREIITLALLLIAASSLSILFVRNIPLLCVLQAITGAAGGVFPPAIAAMTLGITGSGTAFSQRIGRNDSFIHLGGAISAIAAGVFSKWNSRAVFYLLAFNTFCALITIRLVPVTTKTNSDRKQTSETKAKTDAVKEKTKTSIFRLLGSKNSPLLLFAFCLALFHLANAAMLPLVGQKLTSVYGLENATMLTSSAIVCAKFVMAPIARFVGAKADSWGRRPLLLIGFMALPIRGFLFSLSNSKFWMLGVQLLDGVGAGMLDTLCPLVVRDVVGNASSFGASLGAIATIQGIGATLSNSLAGVVVQYAGFDVAFRVLGSLALVALLLLVTKMPETKKHVAID